MSSNEEYKIKKKNRKKWKEEKHLKKTMKAKMKEVKEDLSSESKSKLNSAKEVSTLSIAIPGSILDGHSPQEITERAGAIARAANIYNVDEVIF